MELPEAVTSVIDAGLELIYSFEPLAAKTVVLGAFSLESKRYCHPRSFSLSSITVPGFVSGYVESLSEAIGFDVETLNYTLGLFLCYPLAMIMNLIPYGKMRHLFSFLLGAFLMQFTLGVQWVHQLITSLVVYAMFLVLPRKLNTTLVPTFAMLYLVFGHLHRQYINYLGWDLDFTGAQMVLTQKVYMMAFNLYDGEVLAKGKDSKAAKKCEAFALKQLPDIFEFLGYTFLFSNVLSGPAYEFSTYKAACEGSHIVGPDGKPKGKLPSNVWPSLRPFLVCLLNLVVFVVVGAQFPLLDPVDPQKNTPVILTEEFLKQPWVQRFFYLWMGLLVVRQKYYFAWKCSEGANNVWYAGFDGFDADGKPKGWSNSDNVNIVGFELAPNIQTLSKEWNKKTSLWLTRYVYIRTNGSLLAVYSMSAFWHGFYPGYYLFFMSVPLYTVCERLGRKKISPYFSDAKFSLYGILCIVVSSVFVEYIVSAFAMLSLDRAWGNYKANYFFGHVGAILFYVVASMLPSPKKKDKKA